MTQGYVAVDDVLSIETQSPDVRWSFGQPSLQSPAPQVELCRVRLAFDEVRHVRSVDTSEMQKYHYWWGKPGSDDIYYDRTLVGSRRLRMLGQGLLGDRPHLTATRDYVRLVRFRFNNLHSPGYHLTDLAAVHLLRAELAPVHSSAFAIGDATVLVIAPPDTGKTLTTMDAVLNFGADFIAEDISITDGVDVMACPWTSTFRYYDDLTNSPLTRAWMQLVRAVPPLELAHSPGRAQSIEDFIGRGRIRNRSRITHVVFLARRRGGVTSLGPAEAHRLAVNLNRYEFVYVKNPMLTALEYFNPEFSLSETNASEHRILGELVKNAECSLVQDVDPTNFAQLIVESVLR